MKAVIVAGGLGTRLRPLTYHRPKHLLPVANRPFLEYQIALLRSYGITDITFATNYLTELIESTFGDGGRYGVSLRYVIEKEPLGTAGAIRNALGDDLDDTVLALNGDVLTDFNLQDLLDFHRQHHAEATIALSMVRRPHPFGILKLAPDNRVLDWYEPTEEEKRSANLNPNSVEIEDPINAGIYVLSAATVRSIPLRNCSIEREIYPQMIRDGAPLYGSRHSGFWQDIGRPSQYRAANWAVVERAVKTEVPWCRIANSARLANGVMLDERSCIGEGVEIDEGARLQECIIDCDVRIGSGAALSQVVVDRGCVIEEGVVINGPAVLAAEAKIPRGTLIE